MRHGKKLEIIWDMVKQLEINRRHGKKLEIIGGMITNLKL